MNTYTFKNYKSITFLPSRVLSAFSDPLAVHGDVAGRYWHVMRKECHVTAVLTNVSQEAESENYEYIPN